MNTFKTYIISLIIIASCLFIASKAISSYNNQTIEDAEHPFILDEVVDLDEDHFYPFVNSEGQYTIVSFINNSMSLKLYDKDFNLISTLSTYINTNSLNSTNTVYATELSNGNYVIVTSQDHILINSDGTIISHSQSDQYQPYYIESTGHQLIDSSGYVLYKGEWSPQTIEVYNNDGTLEKTVDLKTESIHTNFLYLSDEAIIESRNSKLVKYSSDGNTLWEQSIGFYGLSYASDLIETCDGNIVIVGRATKRIGNGNESLINKQSTYGVIIKLNRDTGNIIWSEYYGGFSDDFIINSVTEIVNEFITVGYSYSSFFYDGLRGTDFLIASRFGQNGQQHGSLTLNLDDLQVGVLDHSSNILINNDQIVIYDYIIDQNKSPTTHFDFLLPLEIEDLNNDIYTYSLTLYKIERYLFFSAWGLVGLFIISYIAKRSRLDDGELDIDDL
ncbi:hypothetical protein [Haloplasma contractile]|uniref:PKD protein n=1 Tax=Haloplasma contractile SSD-17B TaxID=1033810 RepID=U2DVQ9_9MOLU|nr:hypothetical protein [Haloplasma contractile]ERJ12447.1 PKD protein [Haloplasma contractile SSD-17B]